MSIQQFRPIDAKDKSEVGTLHNCNKEIANLITQVNPKDYQCIATDKYLILPVGYRPDAQVLYKEPRKIDYEFGKFPVEYQEVIKNLQKDLKLTKQQVNCLYKTIKSLDQEVTDLEKRLEIITNHAHQLKYDENNKKSVANFYSLYEKFTICLTSNLSTYDHDTKKNIKLELKKLIHLIEDIIEKYLVD